MAGYPRGGGRNRRGGGGGTSEYNDLALIGVIMAFYMWVVAASIPGLNDIDRNTQASVSIPLHEQ